MTPDGQVRVYETRDRGASWRALEQGLPQSQAYLTVLRQAFCTDGGKPLGLYFGAQSGEVFGSEDGGRRPGRRWRRTVCLRCCRCARRVTREEESSHGPNRVVSRDEWLTARKALLAKEKELTTRATR